ncbi:MAG: hypothetical protein C0462_13130 [Alcanivorax sp.]|uniref:hypothetical protein n=1 Tax=Isoalcanivorax indicus TaxID=2202653 RepID=UPI000DB9A15B|nr:hypothetical protein [Isoalcanivorax indicus]MBA3981533.1 hypothetical protein [Alcanivorax sp.]
MSDHLELDAEDLLTTLEHVEETLTVMSGVVSHLKEQVLAQLDEGEMVELSAEEFLECCDNATGTWH